MRKLLTIFGAALIALLLAGATACGGDDDDDNGSDTSDGGGTSTATLEATEASGDDDGKPTDDGGGDGVDSDYYNQIADILNEADRNTNDISQRYGGPYNDDADEIDQTRSAFQETGQVLETVLLSLADLTPPPEVEDAHQAYFDALQEFTRTVAEFSAAAEDVTTGDELRSIEDEYGPQLDDDSAQVETECLGIQDLADTAGSGADLGCSEQN